eukprot:9570442-Karenia_brevis.AAC.1
MYNKVWRRVHGTPRYSRSDITDLGVRLKLGIPSIDCYVRQKRLKYLVRLCRAALPPLMALLQSRPRNFAMPWSKLIMNDLGVLYACLPRVFSALPPPHVDAEPFWQLVRDYPHEWCEIVNQYFTSHDDAKQPLLE